MYVKHMLLACVFAPLAIGAARAEDLSPPANAVYPLATATAPATPASPDALAMPAAPAVTAKVEEKGPELNALRYYAHSRDLNRVAAEIRRIKLDYPNWNPPEDLYTDEKPRVDEQPLWDLYLKKDYAGIDAKMAEMKQANPDWIPSHDFTEKYAHAKASAAIIAKSDDKQWNDVVEVATHQDGMVNCSEIDLAWRIAEGFARSGDEAKATDIYRFLLTSCTNQAARVGTAQRASDVLTDAAKVDALVALGKQTPDGKNEFAPIVEGRIRADLGEFATGKSTTPVAPERIAAFEKTTTASKKSEDALLLGWYYRKTKERDKALNWTRIAFQGAANAKTAEAYALALREAYDFDDAERLSYEWRDKGDQFRKMYIDIVSTSITAHGHDAEIMRRQSEQETLAQAPVAAELTGSKGDVYGQALDRPMVYCGPQRPLTPPEIERLMRFKVEVETAKSAVGGQALGWRLYEANRPTDAAFWFEHSMVWAPNEPAAVGLAVTAKRFNKLGVYRALLAKYGSVYPGLLALNARQRNCSNTDLTASQSGVTTGWTPGRLFSSVPNSTAAYPPVAGTNGVYAPNSGSLAPTSALTAPAAGATGALQPAAAYPAPVTGATGALQPTAVYSAPVEGANGGYASTDGSGFLSPSDVTATEQRAALETTPNRYYKPRQKLHHYAARRSAATQDPQLLPPLQGQMLPPTQRGLFGY